MDNLATTPQKDFILSLLKDREVSESLVSRINGVWDALTKSDASEFIGTLKGLPFAKKAGVEFRESPYEGLAHSYYAIPSHLANPALQDAVIDNDLLFVVIDQFRGTVYLRQVHGAPLRFTRSKMSPRDARAVVRVLKTDPLKFIKLFGEHHGVCGKCGAHLTDQKSRESGFGPDCRKQLGI